MKKMRSGSHTIAGAFVFLLLGVFAVFSVLMVLLCVGGYNRTAGGAERHNRERIAPSYLRTMVRGHDETGGIRLERIKGIRTEDEDTGEETVEPVDLDAVVLDDEEAATRIFVHNGWLYECSEPKEEEDFGDSADFSDGEAEDAGPEEIPDEEGICPESRMEPVCEAEEMTAEMSEGTLTVRLKVDGLWTELVCALHADAQ